MTNPKATTKAARALGLRSALSAIIAVASATPALAQDTTGQADQQTSANLAVNDPDRPGDIVVTARKRSESIINVPDSITAFNTKQIEQAGLHNLRDFTDLTPNITVTTGGGTAYPNIMVRGLGQAQGGEAPIAVVIDGVQLAHPAFITQDFGDVAQVEVLRGPQGSLYGRNAIGGAINITTLQPTNDFTGRVKASYGNANTFNTTFDLSGPISTDKVLFRIGGSFNRTDGQIVDLATGKPADYGNSLFLRSRLIFNLSDRLTLDVRGNYGHDRIGVTSAEILPNALWESYQPGFLESNPSLRDRRTIYDVSAKVDYRGEYLTVTSVTDYSHVKDNLFGDGDFSAAHQVLQDVNLRVRAVTEELRVASPANGRLRWLLGGFYQNRETDNFLDIPLDNGSGQPVPGVFAVQSHDVGNSKSWAVFGSATYEIVPRLEVNLGARYDQDKRTSVDEIFAGSNVAKTFSSFQPKVQVSFKPTPAFNIYATYSEGFGSGGFNAFIAGPAARQYASQTADNYEAGFKGSLADGLLTFSAAAFRVYYHNQQFFFIVLSPPSQNIANIDKTRVDGAEIEATLRPTKALQISGSLGLTDSKILALAAQPTSVGNRAPQSTRYTANIVGQYTVPLSATLDLRAYASYRRQGSEYWDVANTLRTGPKNFVNLRLFLENKSWSFGAFVNNLTNEQYPVQAAANIAPGISLRIPSSRRSYGVEGSFRF